MSKFYEFNGKNYELPDEATQDQIQSFILGSSQQEPKLNMGEWLKNDAMQGIKGIKNYVIDPMLGFEQGVANIPSAALNLGKHALEGLQPKAAEEYFGGQYKKMPDVPYFDVAPHTLPAEAGEALSFALGARMPVEKLTGALGKPLKKGLDYISPWKIKQDKKLFNEGLSQERNIFNEELSQEKNIFNEGLSQEKEQFNKDLFQNKEQFNETMKRKKEQFNERMSTEAGKFKKSLTGSETESENIENLAKRVQFAEKTGKAEALSLREKIYSQEGKSNIYQVKEEALPEGNLEKLAHIIEPGTKKTESQIKALQSALKDFRNGKIDEAELKLPETYRKKGGEENFSERVSDIFGIGEFNPKVAEQIEDILSLPTSRGSHYFSNNKALKLYGPDLRELHLNYRNNPTLENYDELQSALKAERRALSSQGKIDRKAYRQSQMFDRVISNLDKDKEAFMQTLPENLRNVEKEYRTKWAQGPAKFSSEAELTLQRLASGKQGKLNKVTSKNVIDLFTKPDQNTMAVIQELGPSTGRHVIYAAINKIKPHDYPAMAETILDLSTKRGFEGFVTKDLKGWANKVLKREEKFKSGVESRESKFTKESEKKEEEFKKQISKSQKELENKNMERQKNLEKKILESQKEFERKLHKRSLISKGTLGAGTVLGGSALYDYLKRFIH